MRLCVVSSKGCSRRIVLLVIKPLLPHLSFPFPYLQVILAMRKKVYATLAEGEGAEKNSLLDLVDEVYKGLMEYSEAMSQDKLKDGVIRECELDDVAVFVGLVPLLKDPTSSSSSSSASSSLRGSLF